MQQSHVLFNETEMSYADRKTWLICEGLLPLSGMSEAIVVSGSSHPRPLRPGSGAAIDHIARHQCVSWM